MRSKLMALITRLLRRKEVTSDLQAPPLEIPEAPGHNNIRDRAELEWLRVSDKELRDRLRELELDAHVLGRHHQRRSHGHS